MGTVGAATRLDVRHVLRDPALDRQCLSLAVATSPLGPFVDGSTGPLVCPLGGAIDASPYVDAATGQAFLLWKNDDTIVAAPLAADGRSLVGSPTQVLSAGQAWQDGVVEAPSMVAADGRLSLFYSGYLWQAASYAIGYAVCTSPSGPCVKAPGPWLTSGANVEGPGGQEFFTDPSGEQWMSPHAWVDAQVGYPQGPATCSCCASPS